MLPKPSAAFEWREFPGGPALVCRPLEGLAPHFFTTRRWMLGSATPDQSADAWAIVARAAGVVPSALRRLKQVHGADVVFAVRDHPLDGLPAADIIASADPEIAVAVQAADCVPLLVADTRTGAVVAAHAGWRGLLARVPRAAVAAMRQFGCQPKDLVVGIGPSIGACCYEVGEDMRARFAASSGGDAVSRWFSATPIADPDNPPYRRFESTPGKWYFDGWQAAADQLVEAGVHPERLHLARLCTASHGDLCSYRREGTTAGRIAAVIRASGRRS